MALGKELGGKRCTAVALVEGISRQWVRVCRNVVAAAYLHWQAKTLGYLIRICQAHRPLFAFARYAWDETGEPLTVPVCKEMRLEHQIGVWQVMVSRLRIVLVWGAEHGGRCCDMQCTLPPCTIPTPSAKNIHAGMFNNPITRHVMAAREILFNLAERAVDVSETDGAGSNFRLEANLLNQRDSGSVSKDHFVCRLHAQHLAEVSVIGTAGMSMLSKLYSLTLLMKTYFMRCILALKIILRIVAICYQASNEPEDIANIDCSDYQEELAGYIFCHANRFKASQERVTSPIDADMSESDDELKLRQAMRDPEGRSANCEDGGMRSKRYKEKLMKDIVDF